MYFLTTHIVYLELVINTRNFSKKASANLVRASPFNLINITKLVVDELIFFVVPAV